MSREFPDSLPSAHPEQVDTPADATRAATPKAAMALATSENAEAPESDEAIDLTPDAIIESTDSPTGEGGSAEGTSEPWSPPVPAPSGTEPPIPPIPPTSDAPPAAETPDDTTPMTLTEHLGELRVRLVRALIGASLGFLLCYGVSEQLFMWLAQPLAVVMPADTKLIYTSVPEGFFVYLKVAFVAGVFVASPYIFYQVWAFIAPGLYREERQQVLPLALCSAFFFVLGAGFCYFLVFPYAFAFFMSYSNGMIVAMPSINEYLGFSLKMILAFGLIFEMPLFAFFLARMGLVTAGWMRRVRRYAILVVFVVAAILTPPDVFSQLLMAVPMLVLYEISIFVAAAVGRKDTPDSTTTPDPAQGAQT